MATTDCLRRPISCRFLAIAVALLSGCDDDGSVTSQEPARGSCSSPGPVPSQCLPVASLAPIVRAVDVDPGLGPVALPETASAPIVPVDLGTPSSSSVSLLATGAELSYDQRLLVLSATGDEPSYLAIRSALDRLGTPYDVFVADTHTLAPASLRDSTTCFYQGVLVSIAGLPIFDEASNQWVSAMSANEWGALADFERSCQAREVVWYAWPSPDLGLAYETTWDGTSLLAGHVTDAGRAVFPYVKPTALVPYRYTWGYPATVADPATTTPLVVTGAGLVLVSWHVLADGREVVASTVDSGPYDTHGLLLEHGLIAWASRGLFLGARRAYQAGQIDDIFIDSDAWVVGVGNDGSVQLRITGSDLTALVAWQKAMRLTLPAGSSFITDLAFNGVGTLKRSYPDQTLLAVAVKLGTQVAWLNHTWDHENLDVMSETDVRTEIERNCKVAQQYQLNRFSCASAVTPDVSGLDNPRAVSGLVKAGVRYVVSDSSVTSALRPGNPGDNASHNVGRVNPISPALYQVPRHPTSIFYDVSRPEELVDEYNQIYRSFFGRNLTYQEILTQDTSIGLYYLLAGDIDPVMFHQGNLKAFVDAAGATHSLYADWVQTTLARYTSLVDLPILSLSLADIGRAMQARAQYNTCGATATVVPTPISTRITRSLEVTAARSCAVPITGLNAPLSGRVEVYGGVPTTFVNVAAGAVVSIPLL